MNRKQLYQWCSVPAAELENHPDRKVPFRIVADPQAMGRIMAEELAQDIQQANREK